MILGFGFCLVLHGVGFGSGFCTFFTFGFGSVFGKTWVLVRFVLAGFRFFPISNLYESLTSGAPVWSRFTPGRV